MRRSHKAKYRIGQIIRRKLKNGTPVGPYMTIQHIEEDRVYADVIGQDNPNVMLLKNHVYVPTISSVIISESKLRQLNKNGDIISHPVTARWMSIYSDPPELIRLYTIPKGYESTFVLQYVRTKISLREKVIEIELANQVM